MKKLVKISVCGLVCDRCPKFVKKHCSGCGPNEFCPFPTCAKRKRIEICFDCDDFPCKKHFLFPHVEVDNRYANVAFCSFSDASVFVVLIH